MEFVKGPFFFFFLKEVTGNSLAVQGLGLYPLIAEDPGSIPGWGIKVQQTKQHSQRKIKRKKRDTICNSKMW